MKLRIQQEQTNTKTKLSMQQEQKEYTQKHSHLPLANYSNGIHLLSCLAPSPNASFILIS